VEKCTVVYMYSTKVLEAQLKKTTDRIMCTVYCIELSVFNLKKDFTMTILKVSYILPHRQILSYFFWSGGIV
jgi:hypothetical protein